MENSVLTFEDPCLVIFDGPRTGGGSVSLESRWIVHWMVSRRSGKDVVRKSCESREVGTILFGGFEAPSGVG